VVVVVVVASKPRRRRSEMAMTTSHLMSEEAAHALAEDLVLRFLTHLTREMRTVLHTIVGFAELLQDPACSFVDAQDYAGHVARAADELRHRVLGTLLRFQRELGRCGDEGALKRAAPFVPLFAVLDRSRSVCSGERTSTLEERRGETSASAAAEVVTVSGNDRQQ
jgi:signal transduction histidine kinase